jgi:ABC-type dipeptide/oligopeptide/nickel transport system permease subunit
MNAAVLAVRNFVSPRLVVGGAALAFLILLAITAPWISPHDPLEQDFLLQYVPPYWLAGGNPAFPLGTDNLGRDILSRFIWGARPAMEVMVLGASFSCIFGVSAGLLAGYLGGRTDSIVSRTIDVFMSFPPILLAIVLVALVGPGLGTVIMAVVLIGWTRFARVIRGEVLVLREQDYVTAARLLGYSPGRIVFRELLPNVLPIILALLSLEMGHAIVVEAVLAFIGFSSSEVATWGGIIADGRNYLNQAWWIMAFPMLAILTAVMALSFVADGLRSATDPVVRR